MKVELDLHGFTHNIYDDIWEIQDNGDNEIVLKKYDHTCFHLNKSYIFNIKVTV